MNRKKLNHSYLFRTVRAVGLSVKRFLHPNAGNETKKISGPKTKSRSAVREGRGGGCARTAEKRMV